MMTVSSGPGAGHEVTRETSCLTCPPARTWTSSATRPRTCCALPSAATQPRSPRIRAVSVRLILSSAQLALAREYGFASWAKLKLEVERRDILNSRDLSRLTGLLAEHPELATTNMEQWADRQHGASRSATSR